MQTELRSQIGAYDDAGLTDMAFLKEIPSLAWYFYSDLFLLFIRSSPNAVAFGTFIQLNVFCSVQIPGRCGHWRNCDE